MSQLITSMKKNTSIGSNGSIEEDPSLTELQLQDGSASAFSELSEWASGEEVSQSLSFCVTPICSFRRVVDKDLPEINTLVTETCYSIFGSEPVEDIIKKCYVSMVAINADSRIIAVVCLDDHPNVPALPRSEWETWILKLYNLHNLTSHNTLWIHFIACHSSYTYIFLKPMLEHVFLNNPYLIHILFVLPGNSPCFCFLEENFTCIMPMGYTNPKKVQTLYLTLRHHYVIKYRIRLAVEEDNDDIISIINSHADKLKQRYGDYYVSEILTKFPYMKRSIIVAEIPERAVGVLFANEHINYDTIINNFNLEPFTNLHSMDREAVVTKKQSICSKNMQEYAAAMEQDTPDVMSIMSNMRGTLEVEVDQDDMDNDFYELMDMDDELFLNDIIDLEKLGILVDDQLTQEYEFSNFDQEPEASDRELDNKLLMRFTSSDIKFPLPSQSVMQFELPHHNKSAFSLEVMAADPEHEQGVVSDLLEAMFQSFTGKHNNYCVFGVLSSLPHFPLFDYFVRQIPRRNMIYPREIYALHKNSIKPTLKVCKMHKRQFEKVKHFLCNISYASTIIDAVTKSIYGAQRETTTYILTDISVIIGIMIIEDENNPRQYFDNFKCYQFVDPTVHRYDRCGSINYCTVSAIFQKHIHFFLREVHRISDIPILFFKLNKNESYQITRTKPLPTILRDMLPVLKRTQPNFKCMSLEPEIEIPSCMQGTKMDSFALFLSTRRLCSLPRTEVNNRIVVVGASCTAMSFLESLIFHFDGTGHTLFNNLYFIYDRQLRDTNNVHKIVPYMFVYRGGYTPKTINSMSFHTHVNCVNGTMTAINRRFKYITVNKDTIVPYDYLFLMCGTQFNQPYATGTRKDKIFEPCPRNVFIINKFSDADQACNKILNSTRFKKNPMVIIYGACLNTYACLTALEAYFSELSIKLIEPLPDEFERPSMDPFNNPDIYDAVQDILYLLGVEVHTGYYFYEWEVDVYHNMVKNVKYQSRKGAISFNCDFIFHFANKDVHYDTFTAINNAGLVYDGKLVINPDCRTNDPFIYAAGPMTKYSRRYFADRFLHKYYNAQEIGKRLGRQIRATVLPGGLAANEGDPIFDILNNPQTNKLVPQYREPLMVNCVLPSGVNYLDIHGPGKPIPLETRRNIGHVFETGNLRRIELDEDPEYFRLQIDQNMKVEQIVCFTRKDIDVCHFQRLWGKHERKLNNLVLRFKKGMISNFYKFFCNPYFCALYVDCFSDLQIKLEAILSLLTTTKGQSIIEDIVQRLMKNNWRPLPEHQEAEVNNKLNCSPYHKEMVNEIMKYLEKQSDYLPMYAHPLITKMIIYDVESSPLFQIRKEDNTS